MSQLHELLHASLVGPELLRLMRLLADQRQTGDLYVRDERCSGAVAFDHGRVRSAVVGELAGLPALELLVTATAPVEVAFLENAAPVAPNMPVDGTPLWAHLADLKPADASDELLPSTIPYPSGLDSEDTAELELAPDVVATLLLVDGKRTVCEIAAERRLSRTRHELVQLEQLGLVTWVGDAQTFVPRKSEPLDAPEIMPLVVDRSMLATLSHVDGYSTIKAIAAARRLRRTTEELRALERLGLITLVPPSTRSNQLPPPISPQRAEPTEEPPHTSWVTVEPPPVWGAAPSAARSWAGRFASSLLERRWLLAYTGWLALAEIAFARGRPELGVGMHLVLLAGLLLHSSFGKTSERPLLLALTLAPLVRVVSLTVPLGSVAPSWWYPLASLPLFVAGALAARTLSQSHTELRLHLGNLREQLGVALLGLPLAAVLSVVFVPLPSIAGVSGAVLVVSAIGILVCTGLVEEFLFRGVLQAAAQASLGSHWGLVYASIVYAILHIGSLSMAVVVVSFGVGLAFAWLVARTGSLVGVSLAHGLANIGLYLIGPTISGAATGVVLSEALPLVTRLPAALLRVSL